MLLRINITVISSRTNGPTQQCTRPDACGGQTDRDRMRTSRDKIRGATTGTASLSPDIPGAGPSPEELVKPPHASTGKTLLKREAVDYLEYALLR
jgi:hypothetical protein